MNYSLLLAGLTIAFFVLLLIAMQLGKWLGAGPTKSPAPAPR